MVAEVEEACAPALTPLSPLSTTTHLPALSDAARRHLQLARGLVWQFDPFFQGDRGQVCSGEVRMGSKG